MARIQSFQRRALTTGRGQATGVVCGAESVYQKIARQLANSGAAPVISGTPSDIADQLEDWFKGGAADGFNLMFPVLPGDWLDLADLVAPELQRRNIVDAVSVWNPSREAWPPAAEGAVGQCRVGDALTPKFELQIL